MHSSLSMPSLLRHASLGLAATLALMPVPCLHAATLVSDHFTGNSGGIPAGWTAVGETRPGTTIVESGTIVTLTDARGGAGPKFLMSSPFGGLDNFQLTMDIASMNPLTAGEPEAVSVLGGESGYVMLTSFSYATKSFRVTVIGATFGSLLLSASPHIPSYAGGALSYTISGDADSFRIASATDSYDSGDILYSAIGASGFDSLSDFGNGMSFLFGTESGGLTPDGTLAAVAFDRVQLTGTLTELHTSEVPEASTCVAGMAVVGAMGYSCCRNRRRVHPENPSSTTEPGSAGRLP